VNLLFDTSVWIDHLRKSVLDPVVPRIRGRFLLGMDAVTAAELRAGCRSKADHRLVDRITGPFEKTGRMMVPKASEWSRAAMAISRLGQAGHTLRSPGGALLDAVIAAIASSSGALLVTTNMADFERLGRYLPFALDSFASFEAQLA
jgi:predicted nucleic acid-binding protein